MLQLAFSQFAKQSHSTVERNPNVVKKLVMFPSTSLPSVTDFSEILEQSQKTSTSPTSDTVFQDHFIKTRLEKGAATNEQWIEIQNITPNDCSFICGHPQRGTLRHHFLLNPFLTLVK